ncbi:MAG: sigma-54-dependent transcriptional regulator [bacterium]
MNTTSAKILIVDDDFAICDILQKMLKGQGYQTLIARSGQKALQEFSKQSVDLVLLDLMMPDISGLEVAVKFLAAKPNVPIILLSAYGTVSKAVEATKMGVYDFLEKPLDRDRILVTVRNALARGELQQELARYKQEALEKYQMVGQSKEMKRLYSLIERIAPTDSPALITGENGTGKELVAAALHAASLRSMKPLVKINCAAIPADILESELFGHTKGAFTGAQSAKKGRFEMAHGGTLFLDEIGEMSESMQAKLLRFLEAGEIQKVGSSQTMQVDVRLLTATNQDLQKAVQEKRFREDLFYRINVVQIHIPPLRERRGDIPLLMEHFVQQFAEANGLPVPHFTPAAMRYFTFHPWPGNVRQLRNLIERVLVLNRNDLLDLDDVKPLMDAPASQSSMMAQNDLPLQQARQKFERDYILTALQEAGGSVATAAQKLGMDRANLYRKMRQLGINSEDRS